MIDSMCESILALPKGSNQGDVLLSCLYEDFQFKQIVTIFGTEGKKKMKNIREGVELVKTKKHLSITRNIQLSKM